MPDHTPSSRPRSNPDHVFRHGSTMSLGDHIEDLRRRLILAVAGVLPIVLIAFLFGKPLVELLIHPVQDALRSAGLNPTLQSTGVFEMFGAYVRVSIIAAILVGSPWLLYQLWRFVAPGLYDNERRFVYFLIPLSVVLSITGVLFLYMVILPVVLAFFIEFGAAVGEPGTPIALVPEGADLGQLLALRGDPANPLPGQWWVNTDLQQLRVAVAGKGTDAVVVLGSPLTESAGVVPQYRISEYIKSFLSMALAFGGGFQMPVLILLLGWAGIIVPAWLTKYRRHALLGCCVASAILTPADPLSMVLLAIPLYLLYEFGIILLRFMPPDRIARGFWRKSPADDDRDGGDDRDDRDGRGDRGAGDGSGKKPNNSGNGGNVGNSGVDTSGDAGTVTNSGPTGARSRFDYFDIEESSKDSTDNDSSEHSDTDDPRPTDAYGEFTDDPPPRPGDQPRP